MPHFIIDCSEEVLNIKSPHEIMDAIYEVAEASGLFAKNDIKVRITPFKYYKLGDEKNNFIHIFGNIMAGRSIEQKANLSKQIIKRFNQMFPEIPILSMNITEFEAATYCNKSLIDPENTNGDRHFNNK
ncbi:5-carboxymethyl-2-hydroxymuconate Delta-isomerase [Chryseobacterium paludis]|uniref:5-carboxymethyl-2-hydroxymuconate Delta-isomerase n=1 Tax=Chryseobacterium paludis TaxID=2956784 RepID=UPI0021BDFA00|nr:5-carboxymethyl-2-hydroxymuconate Delta-isomerase [Chryseobacterium paludis]